MSNTTRNSNYPQKSRKNTNNSAPSRHKGEQPSNGLKNKGFKAHKSRNMRPDRSKGMKTHGDITAPRANRGHKNSANSNGNAKGHWIWGHHAAESALANPKRSFHKILMTPKCAGRLKINPTQPYRKTQIQIVTPAEIDALLPEGAVHQGVALSCAPLPSHDLETITEETKGLIIVLDQITDPHNVGAIFRLARAFNAKGIIMQSRNAPPLAGAVTKVAVGTVETVPHVLVTNIANTLLELQKMNWRITGLAGEAKINLQQAFTNSDAEVVVLGAEGPGLRKRVRDCCDQLAKIPMPGGAESLNVSTAAAIALYEAVRDQN
ncbi:MAG: 23S rRNA (guanosine(2251)-2'-O)-methyltransferase RlmB [Alphaproteobacteria bacterium]|nr:MAG: 23S rRNA (guanosine(2251)-2'-O)-methyltransferase RlmB [Alphaproteobacteria bacterium]